MNKTILVSLALIGVVGVIATGATISYLSDTEKSTGNTLAIGTIDISVAGQNPWNTTYPMLLDKPCQTNYINFTIRNVGANPANVWKRIMNVTTDGGVATYSCVYGNDAPVMVSSEPECTEGTGNYTHSYVEEDNLAAYTIYDMYICYGVVNQGDCTITGDPATGEPTGGGWIAIIPESNQVRIDNVNGIWIKLDDELAVGESFAISQSYHLMAWDDAGVETITNWAQGDKMTFDIELEARQTSAPAPTSEGSGLLTLKAKDGVTWRPNGANGTLTYNTSGNTFDYSFSASQLTPNENYCLIYYADDWPGNGKTGVVVNTEIGCKTATAGGILTMTGLSHNFGYDLPHTDDANSPVGAKIWLVLDADHDGTKMIDWNADDYLFEMNLITYDDTDV